MTGSATCRFSRKPGALRNGAPFADLSGLLQQLRHGLLKREGEPGHGQGIGFVPQHGLEAVRAAVEFVLESSSFLVRKAGFPLLARVMDEISNECDPDID
jgi:hypothetical protein